MTRFEKALSNLREYVMRREAASSIQLQQVRLALVQDVEQAHYDDIEACKQLNIPK